jgi:2-C-methyl-D-erythritol 4-phosphate cytidylyltransferase
MRSSRLPPMNSAVIVAAGKGTRMGADVDKIFLELNGRPVIAHTWGRFNEAECIDEIVVVIRPDLEGAFHEIADKNGFKKPYQLVPGGKERQDSVWNGLERIASTAQIVAIQDAARPCTSQALIRDTIEAAKIFGAAVAAEPVNDTIKESADGETIDRTIDRSRLWAVQTPQAFRVDVIRRALTEVRTRGLSVTDDTAACELIGQKVRLVKGTWANPKVTQPKDLVYVEAVLKGMEQ